ncbi:MAG: sensor histidine kinase [Flavobacteriales bacterium]
MLKFKNTVIFYLLFIVLCLFINYIVKERLGQITFWIAFRDYVLLVSLFAPSCLGGFYLIRYLNEKHIVSASFYRKILRTFGLALFMSLITMVILYGIRFYFFHDSTIENIHIKYVSLFLINISIFQFIEFYFYFIESKNRALRMEKERNQILQIQYQTLKEQINPHFLFNTLNTLSALIFEDRDSANQYTKSLAKLYRYILATNQEKKVILNKEIKFIESYFFIQKLRFMDSLILEIDNNSIALNEKYIVPLTLQILIENAIKHNIHNVENPLVIKVAINSEHISVYNEKRTKIVVENSTGKGLKYIKALYLSQNKHISINNQPEHFTVTIPYL